MNQTPQEPDSVMKNRTIESAIKLLGIGSAAAAVGNLVGAVASPLTGLNNLVNPAEAGLRSLDLAASMRGPLPTPFSPPGNR